MMLIGLIVPICVLAYMWINGQMGFVAKLAASGVLVASFFGPAVFASSPPDALMLQPGFWLAVRMGIAIAILFWTKLSDMNLS